MAETFPLGGFARIGLRLNLNIATVRDRGGQLVTNRRGEAYWGGPFTTDKLDPAQWSDIMAFLDECVDRNLRVDFVHPRHRLPRSYTDASWPMIGDGELEAVTHGRQIVVSGLTVGLVLKRGDRLTLIQDELRQYLRITSDLVVASTIAQALPIGPRLPLGLFASGALVRLKNPPVRLAIVEGSYAAEEVYEPSPITFETVEAPV